MKDLSNYIPDEIKFNLPKAADRFPKVLFEGADSLAEIEKLLADKFVALNAGPKVVRFLDAYEKQTMRNNYAELMEGDKIKHETELVKIEAEAKQRVKDAKERLQATLTRIDNLVKEVKAGSKEIDLPQDTTYRIAVDNHYLYYTWANGQFKLADVCLIPEWERRELFNMQDKNAQALFDMFGFDFRKKEQENLLDEDMAEGDGESADFEDDWEMGDDREETLEEE